MLIYCAQCKQDIECDKVTGQVVYPHREDLYNLSFYKCPKCGNFVGTHKATDKPLGCIATPALKKARIHIHNRIDKLWKSGQMKRKELYNILSTELGYTYHTAETRSVDECNKVLKIVSKIESKLYRMY